MKPLGKINLSTRTFKTGNLSADNFKKILVLDGSTLEPAVRSGDTGQWVPCFDSCQLNTLMCNQFSLGPPNQLKCESKHWCSCGADGRSYGHVITKFSWMGRLPHFLSYGAPSTRARGASLTSKGIAECELFFQVTSLDSFDAENW